MKCSGPHKAADCASPSPYCFMCGGSHRPTSRSCPSYREAEELYGRAGTEGLSTTRLHQLLRALKPARRRRPRVAADDPGAPPRSPAPPELAHPTPALPSPTPAPIPTHNSFAALASDDLADDLSCPDSPPPLPRSPSRSYAAVSRPSPLPPLALFFLPAPPPPISLHHDEEIIRIKLYFFKYTY